MSDHGATVQVIAHRGSSHDLPEHTLAAYKQAIADGADAVECDVRLTRDGVLVCHHDRRLDRTSSGNGVLSTKRYADLTPLDFGSWHPVRTVRGAEGATAKEAGDAVLAGVAAEEEDLDLDRRSVLTFDELVGHVLDCGRRVELHVETKHPVRYGRLVERSLVRVLDRHGLRRPDDPASSPVTVMSFAPVSLRRVRAYAPTLPTVLLQDGLRRGDRLRWGDGLRRGDRLRRAPGVGPSLAVLRADPGYVQRAHSQGHRVHVWTVDGADDVDFVRSLGVDAVITNRPSFVRAHLAG